MSTFALQVALGASLALLVLGFAAMLLRRSTIVVVMGGTVAFLGVALALAVIGGARGDARGVAASLLVLLLAAAWAIGGSAAALATYRRRGTENVDELRELRG